MLTRLLILISVLGSFQMLKAAPGEYQCSLECQVTKVENDGSIFNETVRISSGAHFNLEDAKRDAIALCTMAAAGTVVSRPTCVQN